eukprot:1538882-Prymnesium_polylepis.1
MSDELELQRGQREETQKEWKSFAEQKWPKMERDMREAHTKLDRLAVLLARQSQQHRGAALQKARSSPCNERAARAD